MPCQIPVGSKVFFFAGGRAAGVVLRGGFGAAAGGVVVWAGRGGSVVATGGGSGVAAGFGSSGGGGGAGVVVVAGGSVVVVVVGVGVEVGVDVAFTFGGCGGSFSFDGPNSSAEAIAATAQPPTMPSTSGTNLRRFGGGTETLSSSGVFRSAAVAILGSVGGGSSMCGLLGGTSSDATSGTARTDALERSSIPGSDCGATTTLGSGVMGGVEVDRLGASDDFFGSGAFAAGSFTSAGFAFTSGALRSDLGDTRTSIAASSALASETGSAFGFAGVAALGGGGFEICAAAGGGVFA